MFFLHLASIITERFDNTLKDQFNYFLREESKKSVKKRQHKINQTNYWIVFKDTIKVKRQAKRYSKVENLAFIKLFCNRESTRFTSKYEFKNVK